MIDRLITALNKMSNNLIALVLFVLGVLTAMAGFVLVAHYPSVNSDIAKGLAGLGLLIINSAAMSFRGGSTDKPGTPPDPPKV